MPKRFLQAPGLPCDEYAHRRPKSYSLCLSLPTISGVSMNSLKIRHLITSGSFARAFIYFSNPSWRSLINAGEREPKNFFGGNSGNCVGTLVSEGQSRGAFPRLGV
jgi:hypothetical protein